MCGVTATCDYLVIFPSLLLQTQHSQAFSICLGVSVNNMNTSGCGCHTPLITRSNTRAEMPLSYVPLVLSPKQRKFTCTVQNLALLVHSMFVQFITVTVTLHLLYKEHHDHNCAFMSQLVLGIHSISRLNPTKLDDQLRRILHFITVIIICLSCVLL